MKQILILLIALTCSSIIATAQTADNNILNNNKSGLYYDKGKFYLDNYMISENALEKLLPTNIYRQISEGLHKRIKGKRLIIAGSILATLGTVGYITSALVSVYDDPYIGALTLLGAAPVYYGGVACLAVGIPIFCVGGSKIENACNRYNNPSPAKEITFNFGVTRNGTGLFVNF